MEDITIWIRIDGVIGDILSEFNKYFNLLRPTGYDSENISVSILKARSSVTPTCKKIMRFIPTQPEPYRDMNIFPGSLDAVKIMRELGWTVRLFTNEVQREEKEMWIAKYLPLDETITWITEPFSCPSSGYFLVIDHEFNILSYSQRKHEIVFYPYSQKQHPFYYHGIYTWNDGWMMKIKEKLEQQGLKDDPLQN